MPGSTGESLVRSGRAYRAARPRRPDRGLRDLGLHDLGLHDLGARPRPGHRTATAGSRSHAVGGARPPGSGRRYVEEPGAVALERTLRGSRRQSLGTARLLAHARVQHRARRRHQRRARRDRGARSNAPASQYELADRKRAGNRVHVSLRSWLAARARSSTYTTAVIAVSMGSCGSSSSRATMVPSRRCSPRCATRSPRS